MIVKGNDIFSPPLSLTSRRMSLSASPIVYKTAAITTIVMIKIITFNMIIIHVHDNTWYSKKTEYNTS